jgi:hypothetical protein
VDSQTVENVDTNGTTQAERMPVYIAAITAVQNGTTYPGYQITGFIYTSSSGRRLHLSDSSSTLRRLQTDFIDDKFTYDVEFTAEDQNAASQAATSQTTALLTAVSPLSCTFLLFL